jgi:antitoxin VapB
MNGDFMTTEKVVHPWLYKEKSFGKMYTYIQALISRFDMPHTKLFKNGNSQAVRIPVELAYERWDLNLVIERHGDELRIRPAQRRMGDVLGKLAQFSADFMSEGRGLNIEGERTAL